MKEEDLAYLDLSTTVRFSDLVNHLKSTFVFSVSSSINLLSYINANLAGTFALNIWGKTHSKKFIPRGLFSSAKKSILTFSNKQISIYEFGVGNSKKILLVHGWEGQASDFYRMIPILIENDFHIIAFDGPAHGQSSGGHTHLFEFVETIEEVSKKYNGIDYVIGHSMGGLAIAISNYLSINFNPKKIVTMGTPNRLEVMVDSFVNFLKFNQKVHDSVTKIIEKTTFLKLSEISLQNYLKDIESKIMIVHCNHDDMVPVGRAYEVYNSVSIDKFITTNNLGHVKILRDPNVIQEIFEFFKL